MKAFRRGLFVACLAVLASAVVKLLADRDHSHRDRGEPTGTGWRELGAPDFR